MSRDRRQFTPEFKQRSAKVEESGKPLRVQDTAAVIRNYDGEQIPKSRRGWGNLVAIVAAACRPHPRMTAPA
jgi:hypothetical protein